MSLRIFHTRIDTRVSDICIHLYSFKIIKHSVEDKTLVFETEIRKYKLDIDDMKRAIRILSNQEGEIAKYNLSIIENTSNSI